MTRSLRSFPEQQRPLIAKRRLAGNTRGNAYWAAADAAPKFGLGINTPRTAPMSEVEREERNRKREAKATEKVRRNRRSRVPQNA